MFEMSGTGKAGGGTRDKGKWGGGWTHTGLGTPMGSIDRGASRSLLDLPRIIEFQFMFKQGLLGTLKTTLENN